MITREQAAALAALARTIRPAWDELATRNAIGAIMDRDIADVAYAVIRTAEDTAMRTPAAIAFTNSSHWRTTVREVETIDERAARLSEQSERRRNIDECDLCDDTGWSGCGTCDHKPETRQIAPQGAAAARAAIRPSKLPVPAPTGAPK